MKTIQIFDPALCCSSGVCGQDVDQSLVSLFNLAQQPMDFAHNATVKAFLERSGAEALPLVLVDGEVALAGRYPNRAELTRWAGLAAPAAAPVLAEVAPAGSCCSGGKCC